MTESPENSKNTAVWQPVSALLEKVTRYWFFTGKGGLGKTSLASATAPASSSGYCGGTGCC